MRGVRNPPSFVFAGERIAPTICYEDLYGDELALRFADVAGAPTLFANISNIGWFGDTHCHRPAPEYLAHANSGVSAADAARHQHRRNGDHRPSRTSGGRPATAFTRGVLEAQVQGQAGITPYAWWASRARLWPYLVLGVLGCLWGALRGGRRVAA